MNLQEMLKQTAAHTKGPYRWINFDILAGEGDRKVCLTTEYDTTQTQEERNATQRLLCWSEIFRRYAEKLAAECEKRDAKILALTEAVNCFQTLIDDRVFQWGDDDEEVVWTVIGKGKDAKGLPQT